MPPRKPLPVLDGTAEVVGEDATPDLSALADADLDALAHQYTAERERVQRRLMAVARERDARHYEAALRRQLGDAPAPEVAARLRAFLDAHAAAPPRVVAAAAVDGTRE